MNDKLKNIKDEFYWIRSLPDLDSYGIFHKGLMAEEIDNYLMARANKMDITKLRKKFYEIAGVNTVTLTPDGNYLMYRHDVLRFADKLFLNKNTYWD